MRNTNGFGSVYKLSGKRRNPYIARITVDWDISCKPGKPIYQTIGYYPSKKLGLIALSEYNRDPYKIEFHTLTFSDLFELWKKEKFEKLKYSNQRGYIAAYNALEHLYDMNFRDVRAQI